MRARVLLRGFGLCLLLVACNEKRARAQLEDPFADNLVVDQGWLSGADNATDIAFHPDGRAVITQKSGTISIRAAGGELTEIIVKFPDINATSEKGLLGVVADPGVAGNDTFYFY